MTTLKLIRLLYNHWKQVLSSSWDGRTFVHKSDRHRPKIGGSAFLFGGAGAGSPCNTISLGSRSTSIPSGILIHPAIWPQQICAENWGLCPFGEGELGPHLTQCRQGRGLPTRQVSPWSIQPFGHNTPTLHTDRRDNGPIGWGEPFYKRMPQNERTVSR